ncbi:type II toxin-antitoxin system RelE/ParE family toxin [Campylobacter fetus subsp. venerealis]|uniref:type II toxin-antitoxin system RelE/ParE family toxin n=1 Tax=Campylobacter fetus TaxID=196 RepID=UPI0018E79772|nr:type II toxin-antitoxin system RelE/ParE family toxin [Campylobacter fetus]QQF52104.1 type II toxin-antitoxin system RelE/ParE family toxin [Campylobacter fetus subsp. venerealis]
MRINYTHKFKIQIGVIVDYIAIDNPEIARKFYINLKKEINKIPFMPYRYRKSKVASSEQIRDLIFLIDKESDTIEILSIYGKNLP